MLQSRVGCSCRTGATPVGLFSAMESCGTNFTCELLDPADLLADVAEVELHPHEIGERRAVDDDPRRPRVAPVTQVPLEPEEDVVPAPWAVVTLVAEREAQPRRMLATEERGALDRGGGLLERGCDLLDRCLGEHACLPRCHHLLGSALLFRGHATFLSFVGRTRCAA